MLRPYLIAVIALLLMTLIFFKIKTYQTNKNLDDKVKIEMYENKIKELETILYNDSIVSNSRRIQHLRMKIAIDSAIIKYCEQDIKTINSMIKRINILMRISYCNFNFTF